MNAYSIIHNYDNQPLYSPDFNFINTALSYKQQKLDLNRAKLQNLYNQYDSLKVHNDVDQEYIEGRLKEVMDITDRYASMDLSDDNFASSLMANVNQVLDEKVKNAVVSTKIIQAEDAEWAKHKGTDKYSDLNRAYVLENSDRRNYENAQEAGVMYQGGAGFKEYRDLSKKLMDNIPKLQEALKAKWIETGPKEGYFQSIITKEAVDRNKLNGALDLIFDEKDKDQMRINAWGTYDKLPDEVIKKDWEDFYQPQEDMLNKRIDALEVLRNDPKSSIPKAEVDAELNVLKEQQTQIQNYTYENVVKTEGRDSAYRRLYNAKYKDTILDTYSYERVIDKKIDEVQSENIKFAQKIQNDQRSYELSQKNYELNKAKLLYQVEKDKTAEAKAQEQNRFATNINLTETTDEEKLLGELETIQAEEKASIQGMKNLFGGYQIQVEDYKDLKKQLNDIGNLMGKTVKLGGKEVKVTPENITVLDRFKNNVLEDSESEKAIKTKLKSTVDNAISKLRSVTQAYYDGRDVNMNPNELMEFTFKIIKDPKTGKAVKVPLDNPNSKNFQRLLRKDKSKLTPSEKLTLEAYTTLAIVGDPDLKLPDATRKVMYNNFKKEYIANNKITEKEFNKFFGATEKDVLKGIGGAGKITSEAETFPTVSKNFGNTLKGLGIEVGENAFGATIAKVPKSIQGDVAKLSTLYKEYTTNPSESKAKEIRALKEKIKVESPSLVKNRTSSYVTTDWSLSELTKGDIQYESKTGQEVELGGIDKLIEDSVLSLQTDIAELSKQGNLISQRSLMIRKGDPTYEMLKAELIRNTPAQTSSSDVPYGLINDDYKGGIEVRYIVKDGKYTGEAELIATTKKQKDGETTYPRVSVKTPMKYLNELGLKPAEIERPMYSAKYGSNSKAITLGSGDAKDNRNEFIRREREALRSQAAEVGATSVVNDMIEKYYNKQYKFSIDPIDGVYYKVARDASGKVVAKIPSEIQDFYPEMVVSAYAQAGDIASELMYEAIQNAIEDFDINAKK